MGTQFIRRGMGAVFPNRPRQSRPGARPCLSLEHLEERALPSVASAIAHDSAGDLYVAGTFSGTANFDPGAGSQNLTATGTQDVFVAKYSSAGALLWAKEFAGSGSSVSQAQGLAVSSTGDAYLTGSFTGKVDFDPGAGTSALTSAGGQDAFVAKLNSAGDFLWARQGGGSSTDQGLGIILAGSGDVYATGRFGGKASFGPASGANALTSHGSSDAFVWKLSAGGDSLWTKDVGGSGSDQGNAVATDSGGNVYVAGSFEGTVDFDPGAGTTTATSHGLADAFILKLTGAGDFQWARTFGSSHDDAATAIATDGAGNVYTTGTFKSTLEVSPGLASSTIRSVGDADVFITRFDPNGAFAWARSFGGSGTDKSTGLTLDGSGNAYVVGSYTGTAHFSTSSVTTTSHGSSDGFLLKVAPSGSLVWQQGAGGSTSDSAAGVVVDGAGNAQVTGSFSGTSQYGYPSVTSLTSSGPKTAYLWWLNSAGRSLNAEGFARSVTSSGGTSSTSPSTSGTSTSPSTSGTSTSPSTSGTSTSTATSGTSTSTATSLNPSLAPSGNFNLTDWYLTLPTGTQGHPDTIPTSKLDSGYTSQYFYTGSDGAMVFWAPVTGVTTSGSSYPRSELRETKTDGSLYNWNVLDGTATLNATLAMNQVPSTGKVIIGQIHDNGAGGVADEPLLKLVYQYDASTGMGKIVAQVRSTPTSTTSTNYTIASNIPLNTKFSYQIQLTADLTLRVQINGATVYSKPISSTWESQGLYFKAGAYVQDNVGPSTEGGRVSFYALTATHT